MTSLPSTAIKGAQPSIPELVNIRMVYTLCKDAEADANAARAAVKASSETATIPDHDRRLMKERFFKLHGWYVSEKKLLHIDLLNQLFVPAYVLAQSAQVPSPFAASVVRCRAFGHRGVP